ncbi:MAG: hypothetical protein SGJ11_18135 [Phycisphaerae bacterium]|nr:hypothetical protein [Phycisphaerae bacterium]
MGPVFDLLSLRFSLIIVRYREAFVQWAITQKQGAVPPFDIKHYLMDAPVWIIPDIGTFDDMDDLEDYVTSLKPQIVVWTIQELCLDPSHAPVAPSVALCDMFLDLEIRSAASPVPGLVN